MSKFVKEFKEFALRGNVLDMAVGIIIGGAFGKIVSSLVEDIIMPPITLLTNHANFSQIKVVLRHALMDGDTVVLPEVALSVGNFIQVLIDFLIIAFVIFLMVRSINSMRRKKVEEPQEVATPPEPSEEIKLLREIRDSLKEGK